MKKNKSFLKKNSLSRNFIITLFPVFVVILITLIMFTYLFQNTRIDCVDNLRNQSNYINSRIEGIVSSYYGLMTNLTQDKANVDLKNENVRRQVQSMRINVVESPIRLYLKDGYAVTEDSIYDDVSELVQFDRIAKNKPYIDYVESDVFHPNRKCQNYYFPVIKDNEVIAMYSCVIYLDDFLKYALENVANRDIYLILIDRRDGTIILDTDHRSTTNIYDYNDVIINGGNTFSDVINSIYSMAPMFFSLKSHKTNRDRYMYTIPSKVENLSIITEMDDEIVFKNLYTIRNVLIIFSISIVIVFFIHLFLVYKYLKSKYKKENKNYSEIAWALSESYDSIYYVDIEDNTYVDFSKNNSFFNSNVISTGTDFFWESYMNFQKICYSDDIELLVNFLNKKRLLKELEKGDYTSAAYRLIVDGELVFYRLKVMMSQSDNKHIIVASENVDKEVKKEQFLQQQSLYLIQSLSENYESIYYINPITAEYEIHGKPAPFTKNEETGILYGKNFFDDSIEDVNKAVYKDDVVKLMDFISRRTMEKNLSEKSECYIDYRINGDNKILWFRDKLIKIQDLNGEEKYVIGLKNISQEKEQELELKRNTEIIEILASEYTSVFYVDLENDTLIPYSSNTMQTTEVRNIMFEGMTFTQAYKDYVNTYVASTDKDMMMEVGSIDSIKKQLKSQKTLITTYITEKNGKALFCEMKFVKVGNENDTPKAIALGFADKDEEILSRYVDSKIYENYIGIYYVSLENDTIRPIRESKLFKYNGTGGVGRFSDVANKYINIVLPEFRDEYKKMINIENIRDYLTTNDKREFNYRALEGEWRRATLIVIERKNGIPVNFILTFMFLDTDAAQKLELDAKIAEQKLELEKQQHLLEEALANSEAANNAKTTFLNNMSHDIRTPMNAIIGFTDLAIKDYSKPEQVMNYLTKVRRASDHLLALINDVLDMSRIESGKVVITESPEDISKIMTYLSDIVFADVNAKNQKFNLDITKIKNKYVMCDKLRLNQILLNLISNAIKYTNTEGTISVLVEQEKNTFGDYGTYKFVIADNGIGISKKYVKTIFEPFTRERSSTVSGIQGTGLGMTITKNLLDMMNGTIDIDSKVGVGTKITVKIPFKICDSSDIETIELKSDEIVLDGMKILLVDDNDFNREIAVLILEEEGVIVKEATDGKNAFEIIQNSQPGDFDLILMDIQMPIMNGFEATKQIRALENKELSQIPIIAMTANAFEEDRQASLKAGMNEHVSKPIDVPKLIDTIKKFWKKK